MRKKGTGDHGQRNVSLVTEDEEKFCIELIKQGNYAKAFKAVFPHEHLTEKSIRTLASRLVNKKRVRDRVKKLQDNIIKKNEVEVEDCIGVLAKIVNANIFDFITQKDDGKFTTIELKDIGEIPDEIKGVVHSIRQAKNGFEIKLYNKIEAIDKLAKLNYWYREAEEIVKESEDVLEINKRIAERHQVTFKDFSNNIDNNHIPS